MARSVIAFCTAASVLAFAGSTLAQELYTPDHPVVEEMARAGATYLENNPQSIMGEALLAGITVLEVQKRYDQEIQPDHPVIRRALNSLLPDLARLRANERADNLNANHYAPCIAVIFLAELDANRYAEEIKLLMDHILNLQQRGGAYGYHPPSTLSTNGDTSQSQYIALMLAVAKIHDFTFDAERAKNLLEWFCRTQLEDGSWTYHYTPDYRPEQLIRRHSLHLAGMSSIYVLGDILNLNPRMRDIDTRSKNRVGLPPSVAVYVKPRDPNAPNQKDGPLVSFDGQRLSGVKQRANRWMQNNFTPDSGHEWNYYYLYGFERYAYFREKSDGVMSEFPTWYDIGVQFLQTKQLGDGGFDGPDGVENRNNSTCFAVLFLVRSSQLLMREPNDGLVSGNQGFQTNMRLTKSPDGTVLAENNVQNLDEILGLLKDEGAAANLERINDSIGTALKEFQENDSKSRGEQMAFLRGLVTDENGDRRWFAVKFLASQQEMDNVPALLFALSDPSLAVAREAHYGLRLTSRKLDAFTLSPNPTRAEFRELKKRWEEWYLSIRPGAELWPDVED